MTYIITEDIQERSDLIKYLNDNKKSFKWVERDGYGYFFISDNIVKTTAEKYLPQVSIKEKKIEIIENSLKLWEDILLNSLKNKRESNYYNLVENYIHSCGFCV